MMNSLYWHMSKTSFILNGRKWRVFHIIQLLIICHIRDSYSTLAISAFAMGALHYCLWGVLKINPEFRIFWYFLTILNLLRCMNDEFKKFDTFKPKISNFKVPWLKNFLLEWVILCSKMSTFEPRFWRLGRARPRFSLPSYNQFFKALFKKIGLVLWFLKV